MSAGDSQRRGSDGAEAAAEHGEDSGEEAKGGAGGARAPRRRQARELVGQDSLRGILLLLTLQETKLVIYLGVGGGGGG